MMQAKGKDAKDLQEWLDRENGNLLIKGGRKRPDGVESNTLECTDFYAIDSNAHVLYGTNDHNLQVCNCFKITVSFSLLRIKLVWNKMRVVGRIGDKDSNGSCFMTSPSYLVTCFHNFYSWIGKNDNEGNWERKSTSLPVTFDHFHPYGKPYEFDLNFEDTHVYPKITPQRLKVLEYDVLIFRVPDEVQSEFAKLPAKCFLPLFDTSGLSYISNY